VDKVITTVLLIVAGVICVMVVFNSVYPAVNRSSQAMVSMADRIDERMKSRINIVHATSSSDRQSIYLWIKNTGSSRIVSIEESDVFFGQSDNFSRISYVDDAGGSYPRWEYSIENNTEWSATATLKVSISYDSDPGAGTYYIKMVIPNGISDEYFFSM
jgi:archaellum component FlaF (FlaF/FlaG flagellin family)